MTEEKAQTTDIPYEKIAEDIDRGRWPVTINPLVQATEPEFTALMRALDYMERKATKSEYWAKELGPLLGGTGLLARMRSAAGKFTLEQMYDEVRQGRP